MISSNKVKMSKISYDEVNNLIDYDHITGVFRWKVSKGTRKAGAIAGCINKSTGYMCIRINKKGYAAHRLAWLLHYGYLPENNIDHIDKNKVNNSISNLREASQSCNAKNASTRKNSISGIKGVRWHHRNKVWEASIFFKGRENYIKGSKDFDEAVAHRLAVEQCLGSEWCDSESDAYLHMQKILNPERKVT